MDPVRIGVCLLLIVWFTRPSCGSTQENEHDNSPDPMPCTEGPGAVTVVRSKIELIPFGSKTYYWRFYPVSNQNYKLFTTPTSRFTTLKNIWINSNKGRYFMKCYDNVEENKFGVSIYQYPGGEVKAIKTVEVTSCDPEILDSITMMSRRGNTHTVMLRFQNGCCEMHSVDFEVRQFFKKPCQLENGRSPQQNDNGFRNGWGVIQKRQLDNIIKSENKPDWQE